MKQTIFALGASCLLSALVGAWIYRLSMMRSAVRIEDVESEHRRCLKTVADQFRSSAVAISYSAGLLGDFPGDERRSDKALGRIIEGAEELMRMSDELVAIYGPEDISEKDVSPTQACDIGAEIHRVVSRENSAWSKHLVRIRAPEHIEVATDVQAVRRVLEVLLTNAAAYSAEGTLIVVRAHASASELTISVDDEGQGVDPSEHEKIFDTLHRGEMARRARPGLGLGLTIARRMVGELGGRLWLDSHPVRGSTFSFTLPFDREPKIRMRVSTPTSRFRTISG